MDNLPLDVWVQNQSVSKSHIFLDYFPFIPNIVYVIGGKKHQYSVALGRAHRVFYTGQWSYR